MPEFEDVAVVEFDVIEEPRPCPCCGDCAFILGTLGNRVWFRCEACGADFSTEA